MRRALPFLALLLSLLLLAAPACDDAPQVTPKDLGIVLGAAPRSVCPDVGGTGEVSLEATVYARDGSALEGVTVFFSTSDPLGDVDPEKTKTNTRGAARAILSTEKTDLITVTARVEEVGRDTAEIEAPATGRSSGFPTPQDLTTLDQAYFVNELFDMFMVISEACHAKTIDFELSYDPTYLEFQEAVETLGWVDPDLVEVTVVDQGGYLVVTVAIDPASDVDFTGNAGFLRLRFKGIQETPTDPDLVLAEFEMPYVRVEDSAETAYRMEPGGELPPVQILPEPDP
jgi:hypothetical protein